MNTTVTAMEARKRFGEILNSAYYRGESTVIERKGKPIAKVVPVLSDMPSQNEDLFTYFGIWKNRKGVAKMKKEIMKFKQFDRRKIKSL